MEKYLISVIMPAYNAQESFLREAVMSVLQQTYSNFELLIIDDGSEKAVSEVIADISDKRVQVIKNARNQGLPYSLNRGIEEAKGKYIFRMDADDKCVPVRFEKQVKFLEENKEIDVVSTFARTFGANDLIYRSKKTDELIKAELLWKNPLVHPTVAMRVDTIKKRNIRYQLGTKSEDFGLWSKMAFEFGCKFAVLPEVLLYYRIHEGQITKTSQEKLIQSEKEILKATFASLNICLDLDEMEFYLSLRNANKLTLQELKRALLVFRKVLKQVSNSISKRHLTQMYLKALIKLYIKKV